MDYTPLVQSLEAGEPVGFIEPYLSYHQLQAVTEPQKKRGARYSVTLILTLIMLAKLAGETTLAGMAQWVSLRSDWLAEKLQLSRRTITTSTELSDYFHKEWESIAQVFQMERTITVVKQGEPHTRYTYSLTASLPGKPMPRPSISSCEAIGRLKTVSDFRRDATLKEVASLVHIGEAPADLAALNSAVLVLIDRLGATKAWHLFAAQRYLALHLLLSEG